MCLTEREKSKRKVLAKYQVNQIENYRKDIYIIHYEGYEDGSMKYTHKKHSQKNSFVLM